MNKISIYKLIHSLALLSASFIVHAETSGVSYAIQEQIEAAGDCELIAYGVPVKDYDPDKMFSSCVETRAILIAMIKKYGVGKQGEVNAFDKIEGYALLSASENTLVQHEAAKYTTAAGVK